MSQIQQPGSYDPTYRSGGTEPPDPNERLKQLQIELDQNNARLDHLTKQRDALKTDITDLSTSVTAVKATVSAYGAALQDIEGRLHALHYFHEQKNKMIMAAIGDKRVPIDDLISDFDHELERMEQKLIELGERQEEAQEESEEADNVQAARQAAYDSVNQYQQHTTDQITDMEGLRTQIMLADDNTDVASMYFLVLEVGGELHHTHIISQHQLASNLRQKLSELESAKENARAKSAAFSSLQAEYNAHQATLEAKRAGRRAKLLAEIQAKFPAPAPPAPAPPAPAAAAGSSTAGGTTTAGTTASGATTPAATTSAKGAA
jgi:hypothetical protein